MSPKNSSSASHIKVKFLPCFSFFYICGFWDFTFVTFFRFYIYVRKYFTFVTVFFHICDIFFTYDVEFLHLAFLFFTYVAVVTFVIVFTFKVPTGLFSALGLLLAGHFSRWIFKWATSRQYQQNDCAPSEDSAQSGHPPSLIRVFAVCLQEKDHKNTNEFCLKVFGKLHILMQTAWRSGSYFWRYCDFMFSKWLQMEAAILK